MPFYAVLDACVLYPYSLRDTLLRFAESEFYAPLWSDRILDEMERNVVKNGGSPEALARTRLLMGKAFDSASVSEGAIAALESSMTNDPGDRHVLAAAVSANADVVVTSNLKHFPESSSSLHGVDVQHPDEFLTHLYDLDRSASVAILRQQADDQVDPPLTIDQLLEMLSRAGASKFVETVRADILESDGLADEHD
jgi:predicted nucleic acid-binding protein